ncbi:YlbE-like family protein [Oceanobacillus damuensis]|uniref:YlbE-like family protein n=1 Tax=Oceanobacillus damuensis TaxID=937928 RepID=UPI00082C992E|nr:YlbE-like family protein [Oceanobacillus damuensis]
MDSIVEQYLKQNPASAAFVRYNPIWYRYLSRNPGRIREMEKEAKIFYGKTFPQQLENLNNRIQMINMLTQVAKAMKD